MTAGTGRGADGSLTRRSYLGALLAVGGLAGCATETDRTTRSPPTETTRRSTETTTRPTTTTTTRTPTTTAGPPETTVITPTQTTTTRSSPTPGQSTDAVEQGDWQLANVTLETQRSYVGVSAIVYNASTRTQRARIRFALYDVGGTKRYEAVEWVRIEAGEERHVARWWKLDRPGTSSPRIESADVEILELIP